MATFLFALISVLLPFIYCDDDPCSVTEGLLDPGTIEACINSVTFTNASEEIAGVLKTVEGMLEGYCFRDASLHLPDYYSTLNVDLLGEIKALTANDGDRVYDYYRSILAITDKVHDSHFNFRVPCVRNLSYVLPYQFDVQTETSESGSQQLTLYIRTSNESAPIPSGSKVLHLTLGDEEDIEGEDPVTTISRWAYHHIGNIRSPMGRLNYAIASIFTHRSPTMGISPTPITITFQEPDSTTTRSETVSFQEYALYNYTSKDALCGLRATPDTLFEREAGEEEEKKMAQAVMENMRRDKTIFHETQEDYDKYLAITHQKEAAERVKQEAIDAQLKKIIHSSRNNDWIDEQPDVFDSTVDAVGYVYKQNKIGVFQLPSYMYLYENHSLVCEALIDTVVAAKEANVEKFFFINLLNGGGSATLMDFVRDLFWPNQFPVASSQDMPISTFARFISDHHSPDEPSVTVDFDSLTERHILDREPYVNVTYTGTFNGTVVSRTFPYSRRFRFIFYEDEKSAHKKIPDFLRREPPFTPQQLVFITDYFCVSACAFTLKWAQENHFAKVIGVGADLYNPDNLPSDSSNSPSGPVVELGSLFDLQDKLHVDAHLPPHFPRESTDCRITFGATYSVQPEADGQVSFEENMTMNEFKVIPPDYRLNIIPPSGASAREDYLRYLVQQSLPLIDTCVSWEIAANSTAECAKGPTRGAKISHALYGHPCDTRTGTFDKDTCVFFRCDYNYHLTTDGRCVKNPRNKYRTMPTDVFDDDDDDDDGWSNNATVMTVFIVLAVLLLVSLILILLCTERPRKTRDYEPIPTTPSKTSLNP